MGNGKEADPLAGIPTDDDPGELGLFSYHINMCSSHSCRLPLFPLVGAMDRSAHKHQRLLASLHLGVVVPPLYLLA